MSKSLKTAKAHTVLALDHIYDMDCIAGMQLIPDDFIDLIITDPPFAINFKARRGNYHRTPGRVLEGYAEIQASEYLDFTLKWLTQAYRILKSSGSMYVFSGWNNLKEILTALDQVGFITVNHLIWQYQFGVVTKRRYVSSHYHCLYVCKNDRLRKFYPYSRFGKTTRDSNGRSLHYQDKEDVWRIKREYWTGKTKTPTKLPAEIIRKILRYSSEEGDLICDPFLGSGQVAVVSKELKRRYIGFEINPIYYEFARQRLNNQSMSLFANNSSD
ncbi:MAG: site-specific DNA-methyltransferase [Candidatus Neomarinimicrobiota bacterium]|nr:site-specific DNA-methyltransferase [Candidatus Neomarinimicrobiota bacterium]